MLLYELFLLLLLLN